MRYPGGKGKCYQRLINLMPPHDTYIETHLGGGAVLRNKRAAKVNIGIDCDPTALERWQDKGTGLWRLVLGRAEDVLRTIQLSGRELVYCDPPYLPETRRRTVVYRHDYSHHDHEALLELLSQLPCKVMVSGYDNDLYNDALVGWTKTTFQAMSHTGVREECVWMNYPMPTELHDARYLGNDFRSREVSRRRQHRLYERIRRLSPAEQRELAYWLRHEFDVLEAT